MLYLIRHAASAQHILRQPGDLTPATPEEWTLDHDLSERGQAEARRLAHRLPQLPAADRILTSPRLRTRRTAELAGISPEKLVVDDRLHEWHGGEPPEALRARARWLLEVCDDGVTWAFTHGGYIRAVVAALQAGDDLAHFDRAFHGLRRSLAIWNASITLIGHGAAGLELFGVNVCPDIDEMVGTSRPLTSSNG